MKKETKKIIIIAAAVVVLLITGALIGGSRSSAPEVKPSESSAAQDNGNGPSQNSGESATEAAMNEHVPGEPVDDAWFDDAVFVGDSVTLKLSYYCDSHPEALGESEFFCAGSLGYANALWDIDDPIAVHPFYKGANYLTEDCAVQTGAKKVFVMLGMNDIALYGIDGTISNADELFGRMLSKSPDVSLYVQSVTPILPGHEAGDWNNENIREFNKRLESYCKAHNYQYIDLYPVMADEDGYLRAEYCGDPDAQGIHFTDVACLKWIETLKNSV